MADKGISILVLTKNEEINIQGCLESVLFSDDIVILDSYSEDGTLEIARGFPNTRIYQRRFDNWANHSNWALQHIEFAHNWVYYIDADERLPSPFVKQLRASVEQSGYAAFQVRYDTYLRGRRLRHGGVGNVWVTRLFQPAFTRYEGRLVNAHPVVAGKTGRISCPYDHYTFSHGLAAWLRKHNDYSTLEAAEGALIVRAGVRRAIRRLISTRLARRSVKEISFFLPMRGSARFIYNYVIRCGVLDGRAGLRYAFLISVYESWIGMKLNLRDTERNVLHDCISDAIDRLDGAASSSARKKIPIQIRFQLALLRRSGAVF